MNETAPVKTLVESNKMSSSAITVIKADVPSTVIVPVSMIPPVVTVADRAPPTSVVAKSNWVAFIKVALPVPSVVTPTAPVTASWFRVIALPPASVVAVKAPVTVAMPAVSVIAPPDVSTKSPRTVDTPRFSAVVPLSRVASPVVPVVVNETAPPKALV